MEWWQWLGPVSALVASIRLTWNVVRDWREGESMPIITDHVSVAALYIVTAFLMMDGVIGTAFITALCLVTAVVPERWWDRPVPLLDRLFRRRKLPEQTTERLHD